MMRPLSSDFVAKEEDTGQLCAVILGGWSPGPLVYVAPYLVQYHHATLIRPSIPMPPVANWCAPRYGLFLIVLVLLFWAGRHIIGDAGKAFGIVGYLFALLAVLVLLVYYIRWMVAEIVRSSVRRGVQMCLEILSEHHVDIIVGFSWGGAVLAELLVEGLVGGEDQPAALLIAPTTAMIASISRLQDAALRVRSSNDLMLGRVHVVHADQDGFYCPNADRWQQIPGIELTVLNDNHVFQKQTSRSVLLDILMGLLQQRRISQQV